MTLFQLAFRFNIRRCHPRRISWSFPELRTFGRILMRRMIDISWWAEYCRHFITNLEIRIDDDFVKIGVAAVYIQLPANVYAAQANLARVDTEGID